MEKQEIEVQYGSIFETKEDENRLLDVMFKIYSKRDKKNLAEGNILIKSKIRNLLKRNKK